MSKEKSLSTQTNYGALKIFYFFAFVMYLVVLIRKFNYSMDYSSII